MEDITITQMDNGALRVTLNTPEAKDLAIDEPEFAPLVTRRDKLVFLDVKKTSANRKFVVTCCRKNNLTLKTE